MEQFNQHPTHLVPNPNILLLFNNPTSFSNLCWLENKDFWYEVSMLL